MFRYIGALGTIRTPDPPGRSRPLCPLSYEGLEVQAGVEPAHSGFADRRVPVSPLHPMMAAPQGFEPRLPRSERGVLPIERQGYLVCVARFERAVSSFQGRRITRLSYTQCPS
jgi:hypothetical protein